ncbi:ABC transporter permease [Companilactobacillus halodurans]|uniref:ABC transporter permease subunit n=1 Tax=Companilactobacillus halodurans TaxID=2584183 RepID=A0A5P0ZXM7_9LACO|nr:ABC transporter permease subunit [Companilactobacillus halodurans]MQS76640.1 ABC transporter permease subunit [Companilactobacillus halodurans]MQS97799.1 ABC transporter permease subunit [Companilactobacillus halodurans]
MMKKALPRVILGIIFVYLLLPILATLVYSLSTSWVDTLLPEGLTLKWYVQLVGNTEFLMVIFRSLVLSVITTIVGLAIFVPMTFYLSVYNQKLKSKMRFVTMLPFIIPGIILVTGLIQLYGELPVPKIVILILVLSVMSLPLVYQCLSNVFISKDFKSMFEQSQLLGYGPVKSFINVVLPNIKTGLIIATLLLFATGFGDFVLTNLFLGGNYVTLKIYMYRLMQVNGNAGSVLTIIYFIMLSVLSLILIKTTRKSKKG